MEEKITSDTLKGLLNWWQEAGVETMPQSFQKHTQPAVKKEASISTLKRKQAEKTPLQQQGKNTPFLQKDPFAALSPQEKENERLREITFRARKIVAEAETLSALKEGIEKMDAGTLSVQARQAVFARGNPKARIMIIGEAPGEKEDQKGIPFVGRSGQLLDKMFQAIHLGAEDVYISNIVNWRPPNNRTPSQEEIRFCLPFIERHIALVSPEILVLAGAVPAQALLSLSNGITRIRGQWFEYSIKKTDGTETGTVIPAMPIYHPAYLLRRPQAKKEAWKDLQALDEKLKTENKA